MKEDAITTFNRRLRILAMFKGSEPLTTRLIYGNRSLPSPAGGRGVGGEGRGINTLPPHPGPLPNDWGRGD